VTIVIKANHEGTVDTRFQIL